MEATTCPFTVLTLFSSDQLIPASWTENPSSASGVSLRPVSQSSSETVEPIVT